MANEYTIHLINNGENTQTFWCFLSRPKELEGDPQVFANSSASLAVDPNDPGDNSFTIPVQYIVGAGASNNAAGLNVIVSSDITLNADLGKSYTATYASNVPPDKGPKLLPNSTNVSENQIQIVTAEYTQTSNEDNDWFSNQSFGIQTASGFIGMTWDPSPSVTRTLTPKLTFYVNIGDFGSSQLASWTEVGNNAAVINVPDSFQHNECTVTLQGDGTFVVTPGKPVLVSLRDDLRSVKSPAFGQLLAMAYLADGLVQTDTIMSIHFDSSPPATEFQKPVRETNGVVSGSISVATALGAAFTYFVLSGVSFKVKTNTKGKSTFDFSYNGDKSSAAIHDILRAGAVATFGGAPPKQ